MQYLIKKASQIIVQMLLLLIGTHVILSIYSIPYRRIYSCCCFFIFAWLWSSISVAVGLHFCVIMQCFMDNTNTNCSTSQLDVVKGAAEENTACKPSVYLQSQRPNTTMQHPSQSNTYNCLQVVVGNLIVWINVSGKPSLRSVKQVVAYTNNQTNRFLMIISFKVSWTPWWNRLTGVFNKKGIAL